MTKEYEPHPLAETFPLMEGEGYAELVADIKANGLLEPIVIFDGKILDGRNRYRACLDAGEPLNVVELSPNDDPVAFVISRNVHRRHLTESQRAIAAAKLANMPHGGPRTAKVSGTSEQAATLPISQAQAAKALNVSERSVRKAAKTIKEGTPDLVEAVRDGKVSVSKAVASLKATPDPIAAETLPEPETQETNPPNAPETASRDVPKLESMVVDLATIGAPIAARRISAKELSEFHTRKNATHIIAELTELRQFIDKVLAILTKEVGK
jgi:ParB-like chromosome segregation protein Spo0J